MCALHGVVRSISGVDIHVIKLGPCLQRSSSLATRDKQQQQENMNLFRNHTGVNLQPPSVVIENNTYMLYESFSNML